MGEMRKSCRKMDFVSYIIVDDETGVRLMKTIGKLKKQVDSTTDMSEKRRFIEKAGLKQTDDELSMVAGGDIYYECPGGGNTGGGNTGGGKISEYDVYMCDKGHLSAFAGDAPSKCPTCQSIVFYKVSL